MVKKTKNYLSNKDILEEIHKSKKTYCSIRHDDDYDYDLIVEKRDDITNDKITESKEMKAQKLSKKYNENYTKDDINIDDVVIRVMETDHVPFTNTSGRKPKKPKNKDENTKLKFTPFKHYRVDENWNFYEVVRSHWKGDFNNGHFSQEHGYITENLAYQFFKLVERYSQKGNWRGYTWLEDMKGHALVQLMDTALKFDEFKSDNPFSYYTMIVTNCFRAVLNNEDKNAEIRDRLIMDSGYTPSFDKQLEDEFSQQE